MSRSNLPQFGIAIFASQDGADPVEGEDGGGGVAPGLVGNYVARLPQGSAPSVLESPIQSRSPILQEPEPGPDPGDLGGVHVGYDHVL